MMDTDDGDLLAALFAAVAPYVARALARLSPEARNRAVLAQHIVIIHNDVVRVLLVAPDGETTIEALREPAYKAVQVAFGRLVAAVLNRGSVEDGRLALDQTRAGTASFVVTAYPVVGSATCDLIPTDPAQGNGVRLFELRAMDEGKMS